MNRERAEAFLRQLAEAELRRATTQADGRGLLDECHSVRLEVTAQALHAVRAFDMAAASEIQAELAFALGVRQPGPRLGGLAANAQAQVNRLSHVPPGPGAGQHWPPAPPGPWRVGPASQVIRHPDGDVAGELHLQAYIRTPVRACFTGISYWGPGQKRDRHVPPPGVLLADRSTVVDDQGAGYQLRSSIGGGWPGHEWSGILDLYPAPPPDIRWLDLSTVPGAPAVRIDLDIQPTQPHMTMTPATVSPGELLLTDIAAGFLGLASPEQVPLHPSAVRADPLSEAPVGLADIVAALQACGALPSSSPLPGQLAGLCLRLGIGGHGIAAPPAGDLPGPWLSLLDYRRRGTPERAPVPGWALATAELPELDGARVAILGLHNGERCQFLHLLASGVTPEYTSRYGLLADRMPILWLRDRDGRWHTARPVRSAPLRETDDYMLWLRVVPPLDYGTADVDVVVTGPSAEVQVRLPLSWNGRP
jgi:hypothetical protein